MDGAATEVRVRGTTTGEVEFILKSPASRDVIWLIPASDAGEVAARILTAAYEASVLLSDMPHANLANLPSPITTVPVTAAGLVLSQHQHMFAMGVGASLIGFGVDREKLATLAHQTMTAFWSAQPPPHVPGAGRTVLNNLRQDIREFTRVVKVRTKAHFQVHWRRFATWTSGRSLRIFRSASIDPDTGIRSYSAVRKCIYCDAEVYRASLPDRKFGGEHIIAEGLGGTMELPEASCAKCEETTGAVVEGDVLANTLKALRVHLSLRGKKRPIPKTLPLHIANTTPPKYVQVPVEDYPVIFNFPVYGAPQVFVDGPGGTQPAMGFTFAIIKHDRVKLARNHGTFTWSTPQWDTHMLFRMLAKIAHAFATAEMPGAFKPALLSVICDGAEQQFNHIGGDPFGFPPPRSDALHEIGLGYQRARGRDYLVARIRLFARQGGPIYHVVVGESLESSMAKLRRRLFKRSSRMHAR